MEKSEFSKIAQALPLATISDYKWKSGEYQARK
jgi:hypothetical protein